LKRLVGIVVAILFGGSAVAAKSPEQVWVQAFEMSPATYADDIMRDLPPQYAQLTRKTPFRGTMRVRMAVSVAGTQLRVRLSNELGDQPLTIGGASIALAGKDLDAAGAVRRLTFGGKAGLTIPAGAPVLSDPVGLPVKAMDEVVVSIFVNEPILSSPLSGTRMELADVDAVMAATLPKPTTIVSRPLVSGILVASRRPVGVIAALGDSITDGGRGNPAEPHGWVHTLARRLADQKGPRAHTVVSAGISGNRVISDGWGPSALARADRDVFAVPGLTHLILFEGINDIGMAGATVMGSQPPLDVERLIAGYEQLAARAHARGVKILVGTLPPFKGAPYFTLEKEQQRQRVNQWIRASKLFDGVIDFDLIIRDPAQNDRLKPEYDSGDHLHPGPAGYRAMGEAIDLHLFR
jgi:lysophospholipase L1-like esterase